MVRADGRRRRRGVARRGRRLAGGRVASPGRARPASAAVALIRAGVRTRAAEVLGEAAADALATEDAAGAAAARRIAERAGLGPVAASTPEPSAASAAPLTAREREVLELVVDGATNRRIATTLFISEKTASVHVSRILTKLGVTSRHAAAAAGRRQT